MSSMEHIRAPKPNILTSFNNAEGLFVGHTLHHNPLPYPKILLLSHISSDVSSDVLLASYILAPCSLNGEYSTLVLAVGGLAIHCFSFEPHVLFVLVPCSLQTLAADFRHLKKIHASHPHKDSG
jgi:hypothetical protein